MQFNSIPVDILQRSFALGLSLENLAAVDAVCKAFHYETRSPASWLLSEIYVSAKLLRCPELIKLARSSWSNCAHVQLAAARNCGSVQTTLRKVGFRPNVIVVGTGPIYLLNLDFIKVDIGEQIDARFTGGAELQMCRDLFTDSNQTHNYSNPAIGIILESGYSDYSGFHEVDVGSKGVLARVLHHRWKSNRECAVTLKAEDYFEVNDIVDWTDASVEPSLPRAFITLLNENKKQSSGVFQVCSGNQEHQPFGSLLSGITWFRDICANFRRLSLLPAA